MRKMLTIAGALALALATAAAVQAKPPQPTPAKGQEDPDAKKGHRKLPDLVILKAAESGTTAKVLVKNQGKAKAGKNVLTLRVSRAGKLLGTRSVSVPALKAGQSVVVTVNTAGLVLSAPGTRLLYRVDANNRVNGSNKNNNTFPRTVGDLPPPP